MRNKKTKVLFIILTLIILAVIVVSSTVLTEITSINGENSNKQVFETLNEFQLSRWNEIKKEIFGESAVSEEMFDGSIASLPVKSNNSYFNWTNTSKLGITPWNGTSEGISWSTFKSGATSYENLSTETKNYTDSYEDGATGENKQVTNNITYYCLNVSTAEQLRWALETIIADTTSEVSYKINLLKDIDLNGQNNKVWTSLSLNIKGTLYIEGNGHTIYNFRNSNEEYLTQHGFFYDIRSSLIVKNLSFKSVLIVSPKSAHVGVLCGIMNNGTVATGTLLENVNVDNGVILGANNIGGLIGRTNGVTTRGVFIKDCSTTNMIVTGTQHIGGFSACTYSKNTSIKIKYNAKFPNMAEAFFNDNIYTVIIENCYSTNCEIFSTLDDSGAFISCGGELIVRNCFTNNTIYANTKTGVFIGRNFTESGSGLYDDKNNNIIHSYFENCYTSGIIEGKNIIGGFVGYTHGPLGVNFYKNCYSTSMVGMEYAGNNLGGFAGEDDISIKNTVSLNIDGEIKEFTGSVYINCYAAGEVGNITTNTNNSEENISTMGGFIGSYNNIKPNFINCYYDKQTTGMRERGIGYVAPIEEESANYSGQIEGLTGVYTVGSSLTGGTKGLTGKSGNIINMGDNSAWIQTDGLYPQLKVFAESNNWSGEEADVVKCYSQASTSTVFLEHYDYTMTSDNQTYNVQTDDSYTPTANATENNLVYDTIRDITLAFEFSSDGNSNGNTYSDIIWEVDHGMNTSREMEENFNITYDTTSVLGEKKFKSPVLTILNPAKNKDAIDPELLALMEQLGETQDIYKCYEFAPGKNWVSVEVKNNSGTVVGTRKLRLLPMAYVDAGNYAEILVQADGSNKIKYTSSNNVEKEYTGSTYKHGLDTLYTTTTRENLGTAENYLTQETSKNTDTKFAMWTRYPETAGTFDSLKNQNMIGDASNSLTKVEVYKLDVEYVEKTLDNGETIQVPKIDYAGAERVTASNLDSNKWNGSKTFTASDAGWYQLKYYWRLNDGRYLSDSKLVIIKSSTYGASLTNNVYTDGLGAEVGIVPDLAEKNEASLDFSNSGVTTKLGDNGEIIRTKELTNFSGEEVMLGWKNDNKYKLVDLNIEVSQDGALWVPLTIDLKDPNNPYDFTDARLTQYYQDYKMVQNPGTKEYYLMEIDEPKELTTVASTIDSGSSSVPADYLYLSFKINGSDSSITSINSNVKVTTTFVPVDTHITVENSLDREYIKNGEEGTYTVKITPDYFGNVYDINFEDILPEGLEYLGNSIELGEYINSTYSAYTAGENGNASNYTGKNLTWHYGKMEYGKTYYAKFKVRASVDFKNADFVKVDNNINYTYKAAEGEGVLAEKGLSNTETTLITRQDKVYLEIEKDVTTLFAPVREFKFDVNAGNANNYRWYVNYKQVENSGSSIKIDQGAKALLVGESSLSGQNYRVSEDQSVMPSGYKYLSITNSGQGTLEAGKLEKVVATNYYESSVEVANVFFSKEAIEYKDKGGKVLAGGKLTIEKLNVSGNYEEYTNWYTENTDTRLALEEGSYRIVEKIAPRKYQVEKEPLYFSIAKVNGELVAKDASGNRIENNRIVFYDEELYYDYRVEYYYNGVLDEDATDLHEEAHKENVVVENYIEKPKTGYKVEPSRVENLPLTITEDEETNVIKVYYDANKYTVEYDGNGATGGETETSSHTYDVSKALTKNGYTRIHTVTYNNNYKVNGVAVESPESTSKIATCTFKNWNTKSDGTGKAYNDEESVVNLLSNEGEVLRLYVIWNYESIDYKPEAREGYTFTGWYKEPECINQVTNAEDTELTIKENITLYAKWTPNKYTVVYDGNGYTDGETENTIHTYDAEKPLAENGYIRKYTVTYNHNYNLNEDNTNDENGENAGKITITRTAVYNFDGWSNEADGEVVYEDEAKVINLASNEGDEVRLYAKWRETSVEYVPVRTGYTFGGWYADEECTR